MSRPDLNIWHLIARGGLLPNDKYALSLLLDKNKKGWLPVHLAKNTQSAVWLYNKTREQGVIHEDIVNLSLINNAQSIQTKYDKDLTDFFLEQGFEPADAKKAAIPPSTQSRIDLSYYWISLCDFNIFKNSNSLENNPLYIALCYSNSYFLFALVDILKNDLKESNFKLIQDKLNQYSDCIGSVYYIADRAFQLQQIIKQFFNIEIPISNNTINGMNVMTNNAIENLEGF